MAEKTKVCPSCGKALPLTPKFFYMRKRGDVYGFWYQCIDCERRAVRIRRRQNAEYHRTKCRQWHALNREMVKAKAKLDIWNRKLLVLSHYSGKPPKCACCGEANPYFLSIDHVDGGGYRQQQKLKKWGSAFYRWLVAHKYPKGYQVLCYNCNLAKGFYGCCPHRGAPDVPVFISSKLEEI